MHSFLRAIGFSKLNKEGLKEVLREAIICPDYQEAAISSDGSQFVELRYFVAPDMGLVLRGTFDESDQFLIEYYYPAYFGSHENTNLNVEILRSSDKECYQGVCDDVSLGMNLIFILSNVGDYLRISSRSSEGQLRSITFSALSIEGTVILPVLNKEASGTVFENNKIRTTRNKLIEAAREGDEKAIESLTIQEMDAFDWIAHRIEDHEDILSVVSSTFMPYGIENDKYYIIGEIIDMKEMTNHISMEECYVLSVEANDIIIDTCIAKADLVGVPKIGRRFKGVIWLQGKVNFA